MIKEFNNANKLNEFIFENVENIKENYSIETYKCKRDYIAERTYPFERFVIPYEQIIFILKYETIEN